MGGLSDNRPSFNEWYLQIAEVVSRRGDCIRRGVGAVIVGPDRRPRGFGYNGTRGDGLPGCLEGNCPRCLDDSIPSGTGYEHCIETHAEENALANAKFDVQGCTAYISAAPCTGCQDWLRFFGVIRAVWPEGEMEF